MSNMLRYVPAFFCFFVPLAFAEVQVLTKDNFDEVLSENELVLVDFYAPWCGHCKKLEPEYEKAAEELEGQGAILAKVDATTEPELAQRFSVEGFPTLKLFRSGNDSPYEGGRTASDIVGYLKKQMGPALKPLGSSEDVADFIPSEEKDEPVVVVFGDEDSDVAKFILQYANKFRDNHAFGLVTSKAAAGENEMGTIVFFTPFDDLKNVYTGELSEDAFSNFLLVHGMPSEQEITPMNYAQYLKRGFPISWMFLDLSDTETTESVLEVYKKVATSFKDKLSMVHINGVMYKQMAQKLGLSGEKIPALAIDRKGEHFVFPEDQAIDESGLQAWFKQFVDGELVPFIKSEPVPTSLFDENNVAVVVGDNFKEVVLDDSKDVLLEIYAPWCGHCKSLTPTWNELGTLFKGSPSVVIAKSDGTANDFPAGFQVSGFPTIQLITSKGNRVVKHSGPRTFAGFTQFLKENVGTPFEVPSKSKPGVRIIHPAAPDNDDGDEL